MPVLSARARWLVPAAVMLAVGATAGTVALTADATPTLPHKSAAQLLVDLQNANVTGLSGTVVQNAALGLPALPRVAGATDLTSLASGSNTLRVWYAGPEKVRFALLGTLGETDVIRNQRDLWTWSSDRNLYSHHTLPAGHPSTAVPEELPKTPQEAADKALALVGETTLVTTEGTAVVAHRKAYELVFAPKDTRSLVGQIRVAVDAEKSVPLRVQVVPRGTDKPAFEVGFTQISFGTPGDEQFTFTPPKGAKQDTGTSNGRPGTATPAKPDTGTPTDEPGKAPATGAGAQAKRVGTGWTTVVITGAPKDLGQLTGLVNRLPRVSGAWGSGRELRGNLFSVVVTDDGRVAVGAVQPALLYQALGAK